MAAVRMLVLIVLLTLVNVAVAACELYLAAMGGMP